MKIRTHDELEFPIGYDPSGFYNTKEVFIQVPKHVELIMNIDSERYLISNWGRLYNKLTGTYIPRSHIKPTNRNYIVLAVKGRNGENYKKVNYSFNSSLPLICCKNRCCSFFKIL